MLLKKNKMYGPLRDSYTVSMPHEGNDDDFSTDLECASCEKFVSRRARRIGNHGNCYNSEVITARQTYAVCKNHCLGIPENADDREKKARENLIADIVSFALEEDWAEVRGRIRYVTVLFREERAPWG